MIQAIAFFVLTTLLVPGITGAGSATRWAFAGVVLPILIHCCDGKRYGHPSTYGDKLGVLGGHIRLSGCRPPDTSVGGAFTTAHAFGLLFIWYAAISISCSNPYDGLDALFKLIVIAEAFVLGTKVPNLGNIIIGCGLGIWVSSLVMLLDLDVPHATVHAGLFVNANSMGEIAGLVLVAALVNRLWWLIPGILPAFVMSQCRGAFVAVAVASIAWLWSKSRIASAALIIAPAVLAFILKDGSSAQQRLEMWGDILPHMTWMGSGLGSFFTQFPYYATMDTLQNRPEHLHNDWLEYGFETGAAVVFLLAFLWGSRSLVGVVLFVEACFGFPTHMAATAVLGGIAAGHAVRSRRSLRDDLHAWGISLRAWHGSASGLLGHRRAKEVGRGIPAVLRVPQGISIDAGLDCNSAR